MTLLQTRLTIDDFILKMMSISPVQLTLEHLQDWVSRLEIKDELLRPHVAFCDREYQRQLLCRTSRFDLLVLCWQPGQSSTIHDHLDSLNATRVYRGQLTSRVFEHHASAIAPAQVRLTSEEQVGRNDLVLVDRHQPHQIANTSDEPLITLHVYARPLRHITVYCPRSSSAEQVAVPSGLDDKRA